MLSFYDWYADLPVASPQVFGDQTDVPESGDWWDAGYLIMWGSNVPVTRTPDAHWMTEARYRGQKVVAVRARLRRQRQVRRRVAARRSRAPTARWRWRWATSMLKEFFVDRETPYFADYVKQLHRPAVPGHARAQRDGDACVPGQVPHRRRPRRRTRTENAAFKTVLLDAATGDPVGAERLAGLPFGDAGVGRWNLDLGDVDPL